MELSLIPLTIFNIFVNSLLAFFTAFLLIELLIKAFRIKNPRHKAFLKMIPVIKLPLDLVFMSFSTWAIAKHIYPWECAEGTRSLIISIGYLRKISELIYLPFSLKIGFLVPDGLSFSVADVLGYLMGNFSLQLISMILASVTIIKWFSKPFYWSQAHRQKKLLIKKTLPSHRPIENKKLKVALAKRNVSIRFHEKITGSPFILNTINPTIIFPKKLLKGLDQNQFEAVLAHELEHANKKDPLTRSLLSIIRTIFWWIPINKIIKSIKENQELACDNYASSFQKPTSLASALLRVAKENTTYHHYGIPLIESPVKKRIENILKQPTQPKWKLIRKFALIAALFYALLILLGKLWGI